MLQRFDLGPANFSRQRVPLALKLGFRFPPQIGVHLLFRIRLVLVCLSTSTLLRLDFEFRIEFDPRSGGRLRSPDEFVEFALEVGWEGWRRRARKVGSVPPTRRSGERAERAACWCARGRDEGGPSRE